MPVLCSKSSASHSMAALRPRLSSSTGRNCVMIRRMVCTVPSISEDIDSSFSTIIPRSAELLICPDAVSDVPQDDLRGGLAAVRDARRDGFEVELLAIPPGGLHKQGAFLLHFFRGRLHPAHHIPRVRGGDEIEE